MFKQREGDNWDHSADNQLYHLNGLYALIITGVLQDTLICFEQNSTVNGHDREDMQPDDCYV